MNPLRRAAARWQARIEHIGRRVDQRWSNLGLQTKMAALVTIGLVGLFTVFALMGSSATQQSTRQVLNQREMVARLSATTLDETLRHVHSTLTLLAERAVLRDPQASQAERQAAIDSWLPQMSAASRAIFLFDQTGGLIASTATDAVPAGPPPAPIMNTAFDNGHFSLSLIANDQPHALIAVPVRAADGLTLGAVAVLLDLDAQALLPFEHSNELGPTGAIDVIDAGGLVLMSTQPDRALTHTGPAELIGRLFAADRANAATLESGDEVIAFAPVSLAPWGVLVRQKTDEAFAPVRHLSLQVFVLGLLTVIGALALVAVTTRSVINPVELLTGAAQRIAEGDFAAPVNRQRRGDEIGELADSFNTMRLRLKHSMDEIQAWNRELDERVHERTQAALAAQHEAQTVRDDLRAVIDALSDELIVVGADDYRIQQVNRAARERLGGEYEPIGQLCYEVAHHQQPCRESRDRCPLSDVLSGGQSAQVTHVHACGDQERFIDIVASPMRDAGGRITRIVELKRDVTDERRTKESLVRRNQQLSILNEIALTVNQSLNLEDILGRALDGVLRLTHIDVGAIFLQDDAAGDLKLMAYRGLSEEAARLAAHIGLLDGSCGGVLETGQIVIVPDLSRFRGPRARSLQREELHTLVHVPLTAKGCTLGSLCIGTHHTRDFDPEEQEMLNAIGSQIAVAVENARLYAEVQHKEQVRGELFRKAIGAQEEERKRIARELHDDTSQALTALLYAAEEGLDTPDLAAVHKKLLHMRELAQRTLDGVHKLIFDLRPSMLDHLGLVPALRWYAQSRLEPKGMRVVIDQIGEAPRLPPEMETCLFRVVQEAINNIVRHAAARNVSILFGLTDRAVTTYIEDDGIGFDPIELTVLTESLRGLGLMSMRERVELVGGTLDLDSSPGAGTRIHIRVPTIEGTGGYA
ncbi:MAG: GAF domain-containing protein [Chloroflexi bacterium]|nr:GAF domain-containing protein [Chloroflexota bacterium]